MTVGPSILRVWEHTGKENLFSLPKQPTTNCQLLPWLGKGLMGSSPSCWNVDWLGLVQTTTAVFTNTIVLAHVEEAVFLQSFSTFGSYILFVSFSVMLPKPRWGSRRYIDVPSMTEYFTDTSLHSDHLQVFELTVIHYTEMHF